MERERITISIKKNLLNSIDETIDGVHVRNRSHAIETLTSKALSQNNPKNAVILIGGEDALKSIPTVEKNLKKLAAAGFEQVKIAVGYLGDKIKDRLGNGDQYELELEYLKEGEGTGGAILPLKNAFSTTFLVFNNASSINDLELNKLLDYHQKHSSAATLISDNLHNLNGLYILEPAVFDYIPKGFSMLETDIFPKMLSDGKAIMFPLL